MSKQFHVHEIAIDEKKDYERALWQSESCRRRLFDGSWRHHRVNSQDPRSRRNPLFPVNYIDREIRKDMANHARESVQFSRNVNEAMLRMGLYMFDHNFVKPFRVAHPEERRLRHAQVAGLDRRILAGMVEGFFTRRCFWREEHPMEDWVRKSLHREWVTPLKRGEEVLRRHMAG